MPTNEVDRYGLSHHPLMLNPIDLSMREQGRHGRTCKYPLGGSSKDKFSDSRVPIRPHDQQIGVAIRHMSFKHVTNATSLGIDFVEYHLDAMSRQVLRKLRTGPPVSIAFSLVTVRTQTRFAFSKIGIAS